MVTAAPFLSLLLAYALACGFYPALSLPARLRQAILWILVFAIAATPFIIPPNVIEARIGVSICNVALILKLVDLHGDANRRALPSWQEFRAYMRNFLLLVRRREGLEQQPSARENLRNLFLNFALSLLAAAVLAMLFLIDWSGLPFLLEHAAKMTVLFLLWFRTMDICTALTRLSGQYAITPCEQPTAARSPADFWRRYNRVIGLALYENVFKPVGGRRHPVRATLVVFAVSGLIHEYIFLHVVGRAQGYQMLFFMLQGLGVACTLRLGPTGVAAIAWGAATYAFNIITSVIFVASVQALVPFYQNSFPAWLQGW